MNRNELNDAIPVIAGRPNIDLTEAYSKLIDSRLGTRYERRLTPDECEQLSLPPGSKLIGTVVRFGIMWAAACPK